MAGKGRVAGSTNRKTQTLQKIEITALREGLTPVDVMLKIMYEHHDNAQKIKVSDADFKAHAEGPDYDPSDPTISEATKKKAREKHSKIGARISRREKLLALAKDNAESAAPFLHSKLSSITNGNTGDGDDKSEGFKAFADALNSVAENIAKKANDK